MNQAAVARATDTLGTPLKDGDLLAAVDLGSNSFHMVVSRYTLGQLRTVDRLREVVRLAEGLNKKGGLDREVQQRAVECLSRFGQRIRDIPPQRVRAIATNTVRSLENPQGFLVPAESALGHGIEVVSGREEARLVYLGVAHAQPPRHGQLRLVIDIGGGSTECIIGSGFQALERESLQVGCVASTRRFFGNRGRFPASSCSRTSIGFRPALPSRATSNTTATVAANTRASSNRSIMGIVPAFPKSGS